MKFDDQTCKALHHLSSQELLPEKIVFTIPPYKVCRLQMRTLSLSVLGTEFTHCALCVFAV